MKKNEGAAGAVWRSRLKTPEKIIMAYLATREGEWVGARELEAAVSMSRPIAVKHTKVLESAGFVQVLRQVRVAGGDIQAMSLEDMRITEWKGEGMDKMPLEFLMTDKIYGFQK